MSAEDQIAVSMGKARQAVGPPVHETFVGLLYFAFGREDLAIARAVSILSWMVGGVLLYQLARQWTNPDGAFVSLAYFLVMPLGTYFSRAFMPDSLMVLLLIVSMAAGYRWIDRKDIRLGILAGLAAGMLVFMKARPAPIIGGMLVGWIMARGGIRRSLRDVQVWLVAGCAIGPALVYYLVQAPGTTFGYASESAARFTALIADPSFYIRWALVVDGAMYVGLVGLGLLGLTLLPRAARCMASGLWAGYVVYGLVLTYNVITHSYYNLPLIPIVALSLAPIGGLVLGAIGKTPWRWRAVGLAAIVGLLGFRLVLSRSTILSTDYRQEPAGWINVGKALPRDGAIIGLTHDYGFRIGYYGLRWVEPWPVEADVGLDLLQGGTWDLNNAKAITDATRGYRYFLVTLFGELEKQPALQAFLAARPVAAQGDGFILYDLEAP